MDPPIGPLGIDTWLAFGFSCILPGAAPQSLLPAGGVPSKELPLPGSPPASIFFAFANCCPPLQSVCPSSHSLSLAELIVQNLRGEWDGS
jgi:hypothetical protein